MSAIEVANITGSIMALILAVISLTISILVREGKLQANSIGNNILKNNDSYIFKNLDITGDTYLGDSREDILNIRASINNDFVPKDDNDYDLGSPDKKWRTLYVEKIEGIVIDAGVNSVTADDTSLILSSNTGDIGISVNIKQDSNLVLYGNDGIGVSNKLINTAWNGDVIETDYGGTGLNTIGPVGTYLAVNDDASGLCWRPGGGGGGVTELTSANQAISLDNTTGDIEMTFNAGQGLSISANGVSAYLGNGLAFDNDDKIEVNFGATSGLTFNGTELEVNPSSGLANTVNGVSVQLGANLTFDTNNITITDDIILPNSLQIGTYYFDSDINGTTIGVSTGELTTGISFKVEGITTDRNPYILATQSGPSSVITVVPNDTVLFNQSSIADNISLNTGLSGYIEINQAGIYQVNLDFYPTGDATISEITLKYTDSNGTVSDKVKQISYNLAPTNINTIINAEAGSSMHIVSSGNNNFNYVSGELYSRWTVIYLREA